MRGKGAAWRWSLAGLSLLWAVLGLLWAQVLVLRHPLLPPPALVEVLGDVPATTNPERFVVMILTETSLLLCALALAGLAPAMLARRSGARYAPPIAAGLLAAAAVVSLMPATQAVRAASAEGVPLSLAEFLSGLHPGGDRAVDRSPETVTYARPEGKRLRADLWRPPTDPGAEPAAGRPAVVLVHGGGWHAGKRGGFPQWNAWLAERGYVVLDIEYRLSQPGWQTAPADVRCAVAWTKENASRYGVDPDRVALMGRSAGGHLALLAAYGEDPRAPAPGCGADTIDTGVAAVAAFYPPTDLVRLSSAGYLPGIEGFLGGGRATVPERYRLLSPVEQVGRGDPPTLLVHGGEDEIVPPGESERLARRLREAGVPHRNVLLPWANHTFDFLWGGWGSQITRSSLEEFLQTCLRAPREAGEAPDRCSEDARDHERGGQLAGSRLEPAPPDSSCTHEEGDG